MSKKERRKQRHLENKRKDEEIKKDGWESGKLIYENHNNKFFSKEFSIKFLDRVTEMTKSGKTEFYKLKEHAINAVLMFNPDLERTNNWYFLKKKLEDYWDGRC